jgi:hypothetical protein
MPKPRPRPWSRTFAAEVQRDTEEHVLADLRRRGKGVSRGLRLDDAKDRWTAVRNGLPVRLYDYRGEDADVMELIYGRGYEEPGHWSWGESDCA